MIKIFHKVVNAFTCFQSNNKQIPHKANAVEETEMERTCDVASLITRG